MGNYDMKRLFLITGFTAFCAITATAQESSDTTIERNVDVVKEYNPIIKDAGKISTMPELKPIETKKRESTYSVWTTPYDVKPSELYPLDYATAQPIRRKEDKQHFARIGGGNYSTLLGEFYTPIFQQQKSAMDLDIRHRSSFGNVKLSADNYEPLLSDMKSKALDCDTRAQLRFNSTIRHTKELSSFFVADYDVFRYYGYDDAMQSLFNRGYMESDNEEFKQHFLNLDANVRFKTKEFIGKWRYDFQTNYQLFSNNDDLSEHTILTNLCGGYRMENYTIGLDFDMYNIIMSLPEENEYYDFEKAANMNNYTVLKLKPSFVFNGEIGKISIGIKTAFSLGQGKKGTICPDIFGTVKLKKDIAYLYACVTGDYAVNNFHRTTKENKYIAPDVRPEDTYTPIDLYAGVRMKVARRVDVDIYGGYKIINNPYFFVNKMRPSIVNGDTNMVMTRQFGVVYEKNAGVFNAGVSLGYHCKEKLDMTFDAVINKWALEKLEYAWQRPDWKLDYHASYRFTKALRFNLGYQFEGGRHAYVNKKAVDMKNAHNINIGADYKFLNWLDFFVKFDNLLNQAYQSWYGYDVQRFNFLAGLSFYF
jgi:hypothetical protein